MKKTLRWIIYIILTSIVIYVITLITVNSIIKGKVENFLATRLPENIKQSYEKMNLNTFEGTITLNNITVSISDKKTKEKHTLVSLDAFIIEDVSYWQYLFNKKIVIEDIKLKKPIITYYKDTYKSSKDSTDSKPLKLYKDVIIEELSIDNATLNIFDKSKDSLFLYAENVTVELDDILINQETLKRKIPLEFSEYEVEADSVFLKSNKFENLTTAKIIVKHNKATLNNITLKTKYSKAQLSKNINTERDHFNLLIPQLKIDAIDFGFKENKLYVKSDLITLKNPTATIYRDKLVADDPKIKPLYSKMLRNLPIALAVDVVKIENATLTYQEKVKAGNNAGEINFDSMYASIYNVGNIYDKAIKTEIKVKANFMQAAPINVDWSFNVHDISDQFLFKFDASSLPIERLNTFTKPNLNVNIEGKIHKVYTTISGTSNASSADMRLNYENLKVNILTKNGNKKNKVLSAIANIFVKKDSKDEVDRFREGVANVSPDKTKSIFNYIWLNIQSGLLDTLTGDGKKD
ncbi:hypothetical protein ULMS_09550 [Patiriisocius marinistellae]|uniref:DUF748 domain-containing protein n=1 Tax=Patiriisocius marinistellae TaxID=2494560 RepID=A0A5J4FSY5_9FLAO|nr:hypothetical protein [Patiriisocius marinistellae]GEQ85447.1 hypothetical protein ULMS_09550 [Patiriisocius marinistellae]